MARSSLWKRWVVAEWLDKANITFDAAAFDRQVNVQTRQLRRQFTLGSFDRGGLFGGFYGL